MGWLVICLVVFIFFFIMVDAPTIWERGKTALIIVGTINLLLSPLLIFLLVASFGNMPDDGPL